MRSSLDLALRPPVRRPFELQVEVARR